MQEASECYGAYQWLPIVHIFCAHLGIPQLQDFPTFSFWNSPCAWVLLYWKGHLSFPFFLSPLFGFAQNSVSQSIKSPFLRFSYCWYGIPCVSVEREKREWDENQNCQTKEELHQGNFWEGGYSIRNSLYWVCVRKHWFVTYGSRVIFYISVMFEGK